MDVWDVYRLHDYWRRVPPLRDVVAALAMSFGLKMGGEGPGDMPPVEIDVPPEDED